MVRGQGRQRNDDEDRSDRPVQHRQDVADQVVNALAKWLGSLLRGVSLARQYAIWAMLMFLRSDSGSKPARVSKIWWSISSNGDTPTINRAADR